jgi:predicted phage terminase large subunit-like protein
MIQFDAKEIAKSLARKSFKHFVRYTKDDYEFNWHHEALCRKLQDFADGKIKRLMVFMPPRHGKSELTSRRFPAWLLGRNPKTKIIATSYASELASSFNRDVQRIIENPLFHELFPDVNLNGSNVRTTQSWLRNNDIFEIVNHGGYYRCAGVGGAITGLGGEFLIIDDPFKNYEEAKSPTIRKKVFEWYTSTLYTRQEKNAGILLIQTRWHEDDLAGMLLNLMKRGGDFSDQWDVINFPAILESENPTDPRSVGEVLWRNKYDERWMNVTKSNLGTFQFSALYQQNPTPDEGRVVQSHWIQSWKYLPSHFDDLIQSWDMSFGAINDTASFVVGAVYGIKGSQVYLVDQVRGQWGFNETISQFELLTKRYPKAFRKLVEKKANGSAVIDVLKNKIQGIIPIEPEGSKESRFMSCQPLFEAGNVFYPDESIHPWVIDHKAEIIGFPNAKHNDRVDAESQALNHFLLKGVGTFTDDMADLKSSGFGFGEW